jgi:hypothetical protein
LGFTIGAAFHELGHVLCAAIVSIPIRLIVVGVGPLLFRRRFGETWFELRVLPLRGFVLAYPHMNVRRSRRALFFIGGVLGNAALICLVAGLDAAGVAPKPADETLGPFVLAQLFLIFLNLLPFRSRSGSRKIVSDGLALLQLLWRPRDDAEQQVVAYPASLGKTAHLQITMMISTQTADDDGRRELRETLLRALERDNLVPEERMFVLLTLVFDGLISNDPTVRDHLDEWSQHALALGPELPMLRGFRGSVLVALGRYAAGKAMLEPLIATNQGASLFSITDKAFLARAERALGNLEAAQRLASAARSDSDAAHAGPWISAMLSRLEAEK